MTFDQSAFRNARVLITGGLGFIGSNIAHRLVALGSRVTILDALMPQLGGSLRNLNGIEDRVEVVVGDIRNRELVTRHVADKDVIFNLAGQVSYLDSMTDPFLDLDISCLGHLTILEACRQFNPTARIVFSSSRMVYRRDPGLPVSESVAAEPLTIYGIHKLAGEKYHRLYSHTYGIPTATVRIANPYGPRQRVMGGKYGLVNWFLTLAMKGETLKVFGEGNQLRDYVYIDDLVEIFLRVSRLPNLTGQVLNAASGVATTFRQMVEAVLSAAGTGRMECVEWPENYSRFETGDFVADISALIEAIGYRPSISLKEGLRHTEKFYREHEGFAPKR